MKIIARPTCGFTLVELALALGVAAFCLIAILGLLPAGLSNNQNTIQQTVDIGVARAIVADLRGTPATATTSPRYGIPIPVTGTGQHTIFLKEDWTISGSLDADADPAQNPKYRATISFVAPVNTLQKIATGVRILLTWPALADKTAATSPTAYSGSYEVLSAFNRN